MPNHKPRSKNNVATSTSKESHANEMSQTIV